MPFSASIFLNVNRERRTSHHRQSYCSLEINHANDSLKPILCVSKWREVEVPTFTGFVGSCRYCGRNCVFPKKDLQKEIKVSL